MLEDVVLIGEVMFWVLPRELEVEFGTIETAQELSLEG